MKKKTIETFVIASLIIMSIFVGTAAADNGADLYTSRHYGLYEMQHYFTTTDDLYAWGDFGDYSYTFGNPPCPDGCGGRIYVVEHRDTWVNGTELVDVSSDGFETVTWDNDFYHMAWPTPLTPGTYDVILDVNASGYPGVFTDILNPYPGLMYITDPIWTIYATGDEPQKEPDEPEHVYVDIKPSSCPNPINIKKQGLQSIAVAGTDNFDITTVNTSTILITREGYEEVGVAPIRWSVEDVATPYIPEDEYDCGCHELGGDGYIDLTFKFKTQELVKTLNLTEVMGETIPLTLTGNFNDGTPFEGKDYIWVLGEKDK